MGEGEGTLDAGESDVRLEDVEVGLVTDASFTSRSFSTPQQVIAVDPDHQGQGVGSALLDWGVERAMQDGLPVWLDALSLEVSSRPIRFHLQELSF